MKKETEISYLTCAMSVSFIGPSCSFALKSDEETVALVQRMDYEHMLDIWKVHGSGFTSDELENNNFLNAVAMRMIFAKATLIS